MASHDQSTKTLTPPLRWGVLGAARIAAKVVPALKAAGDSVVAIGASDLARASRFADEFGIPHAHEGYQAVLDRDDIDAVYIPLANGLHFRWALDCALAGKHCICEKPLVLTGDEARQLHDAFKREGLRLLEAFMWRHLPQTEWVRHQLTSGEIGALRRVHGAFTCRLDRPADYRWRDDQGGGSLWDVGTYVVNAARLFFADEPLAASAVATPVAPGASADRSCVGWLDFGEHRLATFASSFDSAYENTLVLTGDTGQIAITLPFMGCMGQTRIRLTSGQTTAEHVFEATDAYRLMAIHFRRAVYDPAFALAPGEDGYAHARTMEAIAQSIARGAVVKVPGT